MVERSINKYLCRFDADAYSISQVIGILGLCLGGKSCGMHFYGLIHPSYVMQLESLTFAILSPPPIPLILICIQRFPRH